jgi:hypothetical protein
MALSSIASKRRDIRINIRICGSFSVSGLQVKRHLKVLVSVQAIGWKFTMKKVFCRRYNQEEFRFLPLVINPKGTKSRQF